MTSAAHPSLSRARRALAAYAHRSPATQSDIDQVMRALAEHDDWYVPAAYAEQAWGQADFDQTMTLGQVAQSAMLTVFTDLESIQVADGHPLGRYGGPVSGAQLLGAISKNYRALMVNPASPRDHQWYIASAGFGIAAEWAGAVTAERALAALAVDPDAPDLSALIERARAYRGYRLLIQLPQNSLAQIGAPGVDGLLTVAFTAPDQHNEFLMALAEGIRPSAGTAVVDGAQLFTMMTELGVAGLVLNAGGERQRVLFRSDLQALAAVPSAPR